MRVMRRKNRDASHGSPRFLTAQKRLFGMTTAKAACEGGLCFWRELQSRFDPGVVFEGERELRIRGLLNECQQACEQSILIRFRQFDEAERLQPALGCPHGKHDLRFLADGSFTEVEN